MESLDGDALVLRLRGPHTRGRFGIPSGLVQTICRTADTLRVTTTEGKFLFKTEEKWPKKLRVLREDVIYTIVSTVTPEPA